MALRSIFALSALTLTSADRMGCLEALDLGFTALAEQALFEGGVGTGPNTCVITIDSSSSHPYRFPTYYGWQTAQTLNYIGQKLKNALINGQCCESLSCHPRLLSENWALKNRGLNLANGIGDDGDLNRCAFKNGPNHYPPGDTYHYCTVASTDGGSTWSTVTNAGCIQGHSGSTAMNLNNFVTRMQTAINSGHCCTWSDAPTPMPTAAPTPLCPAEGDQCHLEAGICADICMHPTTGYYCDTSRGRYYDGMCGASCTCNIPTAVPVNVSMNFGMVTYVSWGHHQPLYLQQIVDENATSVAGFYTHTAGYTIVPPEHEWHWQHWDNGAHLLQSNNGLCLTAARNASGAKVGVAPCDPYSELQTWGCAGKQITLLGTSLYLRGGDHQTYPRLVDNDPFWGLTKIWFVAGRNSLNGGSDSWTICTNANEPPPSAGGPSNRMFVQDDPDPAQTASHEAACSIDHTLCTENTTCTDTDTIQGPFTLGPSCLIDAQAGCDWQCLTTVEEDLPPEYQTPPPSPYNWTYSPTTAAPTDASPSNAPTDSVLTPSPSNAPTDGVLTPSPSNAPTDGVLTSSPTDGVLTSSPTDAPTDGVFTSSPTDAVLTSSPTDAVLTSSPTDVLTPSPSNAPTDAELTSSPSNTVQTTAPSTATAPSAPTTAPTAQTTAVPSNAAEPTTGPPTSTPTVASSTSTPSSSTVATDSPTDSTGPPTDSPTQATTDGTSVNGAPMLSVPSVVVLLGALAASLAVSFV